MKKIFFLLFNTLMAAQFSNAQQAALAPSFDRPVYFDISPPLRDMIQTAPEPFDGTWKDGVIKNYFDPDQDENQSTRLKGMVDPGLQATDGLLPSDTTIQNFEGLPNVSGYVPPDTHGEAGLNYFFQTVNCSYAIYNKSGAKILGPLANSSVWSGMPNNANSGDAIVIYDEVANRWLFSQFSLPNGSSTAPFYQMIAVSQTPDPTGSWYRYQYEFSSMPDYPKFGVWTDGYYMATNNFMGGWVGNGAYAYNRDAMLSGNPDALRISFTLPPGTEEFISPLPSDCDGDFPPLGTPNYYTYIRTHGTQRLGIIEFHADWENPPASTFGNITYLNVTPFSTMGGSSNGVPQPDTDKKLDPLSDRLMYRLQYRKFNGYSSMALNHTINAGTGSAGIRWYELRNTGTTWSIYQQATYAIADANSRWMGSIAQDTAGTIAMGYSVSGLSTYPGIRYTGRLKTDPINQMTMAEKIIINGGGSQTGIWSGRCRWGDYSGISIDPASPTTFWYTTEYYGSSSTSSWQTRIASFTFGNVFSSAASATPSSLCTSSSDSIHLVAYGYGGSGVYTYSWSSIPAGFSSAVNNPIVKPAITTKYIAAVSDGLLTRHDTTEVRIITASTSTAGNDTIVCWYVSPIPMNASATNYSKVAWGTAGDGYFSNPTSLVTDYFPGIHDKTTGFVDVKLLVLPIAPCEGTALRDKHIVLDPCTGIAENKENGMAITVFPNPANDKVSILITGLQTAALLTITGMDSKPVYSSTVDLPTKPTLQLDLEISGYPEGQYLVRIESEGRTTIARFIKQ
ncbi:MAG: T9SS type A sorting domain-containing protein [Bacteroidetes bacterium]|nr:T9SS type A sorting domain-containing protein [Bacteroidota bacterium]